MAENYKSRSGVHGDWIQVEACRYMKRSLGVGQEELLFFAKCRLVMTMAGGLVMSELPV